jgi:hypothetical protein
MHVLAYGISLWIFNSNRSTYYVVLIQHALSQLPFDERQRSNDSPHHASPSHIYGRQNIQAVTTSCQRVLNDDLVHNRPTLHSEDTHDIHQTDIYQLYESLDSFQSLALENNLIDCFIHLPPLENIPFILTYANIAQAQPGDAQLQQLHTQKPNQYIQKLLAPNLSKSPQ